MSKEIVGILQVGFLLLSLQSHPFTSPTETGNYEIENYFEALPCTALGIPNCRKTSPQLHHAETNIELPKTK